jgi:hypothetical protein
VTYPTGLNTVVSTRTFDLRGQVATLQLSSPVCAVLDQSFDYAYTAGGTGPVDAGPNLDAKSALLLRAPTSPPRPSAR